MYVKLRLGKNTKLSLHDGIVTAGVTFEEFKSYARVILLIN